MGLGNCVMGSGAGELGRGNYCMSYICDGPGELLDRSTAWSAISVKLNHLGWGDAVRVLLYKCIVV